MKVDIRTFTSSHLKLFIIEGKGRRRSSEKIREEIQAVCGFWLRIAKNSQLEMLLPQFSGKYFTEANSRK